MVDFCPVWKYTSRSFELKERPMKLAHFYINFPGTCEEAFKYYEKVFNSKIVATVRFGEAGFGGPVPAEHKDKIMNIQLPITDVVHLMGSDVVEGISPPGIFGDNFSVSVVGTDRAEADRAFTMLSDGGSVEMPIANAPWGTYFGMVKDKFGINWMVSLDHPV
jgi:PhnB protein